MKTLDNGGHPFQVQFSERKIVAYNLKNGKKVLSTSGKGIVPKNHSSLIISRRKGEIIYIGEMIYSMNIDGEKIIKYVSDIGNSAVPYPYLVTDKRIYLMIEHPNYSKGRRIYLPNIPEILEDPYGVYYGHIKISKEFTHRSAPIKVIHPRVF